MANSKSGEDNSALLEDSPFPLTDTDRWILSQTDEGFPLHDWDDLRKVIGRPLYFLTIADLQEGTRLKGGKFPSHVDIM